MSTPKQPIVPNNFAIQPPSTCSALIQTFAALAANACLLEPVLRPIRRALWARPHFVCLVVIEKGFLRGVPPQFAPELHRDPRDNAGTGRAMRFLRRRYRWLPASNAVQPIQMMIGTLVEMDFVWLKFRFQNFWIACGQRSSFRARGVTGGCLRAAAADKNPTLIS